MMMPWPIEATKNFIFHTPNGLHAKYVDEELAALLKEADFKNIRLSLETSDISLQKKTGAKVTNKDLTNAIKNLKAAGFNKQDIGVYILMGAPWLRVEKTMDDIMFINSLGAKTLLASYSLIPGTKDYIRLMRGGVVKEDMDPLWHNKSIFLQLLGLDYLKKAKDLRGLASCLNKKGLKDLSY
jgi:radical SAM superfamily enzyme YgiQ (UPF0313 family)